MTMLVISTRTRQEVGYPDRHLVESAAPSQIAMSTAENDLLPHPAARHHLLTPHAISRIRPSAIIGTRPHAISRIRPFAIISTRPHATFSRIRPSAIIGTRPHAVLSSPARRRVFSW